jgi:hypothetical protein
MVCAKCGWQVYLTKNGLTKEYLWAHFAGASPDCEWFTGRNMTPGQIGAAQFGGVQESPLHIRLKNLIATILESDPNAADDLEIDTRLEGAEGYRKPDVRVTYSGRPTAFEIQLSSTQLPTILARESFYVAEGRSLIWIAWNPQLSIKSDTPQAFLDIITAHNDNLFSIDEQAAKLSLENQHLTLRVHWWEGEEYKSKLVTLDELTYRDDGLPFAIAKPRPWHERFKVKWIEITPPSGSNWRDRKYLYSELVSQLELEIDDTELSLEYEIEALLCLLVSLERNSIIGSRQKSLTEMLHTFLTTPRRQHLSKMIEFCIRASGNGDLLQRPKTTQILASAMEVPQASRASVEARIIRALFPEWAVPTAVKGIRRTPTP